MTRGGRTGKARWGALAGAPGGGEGAAPPAGRVVLNALPAGRVVLHALRCTPSRQLSSSTHAHTHTHARSWPMFCIPTSRRGASPPPPTARVRRLPGGRFHWRLRGCGSPWPVLLARLRPAPPRPHTCPLSPTAPSPHPAVNTLHPGVVNTELARYLLPGETAWWQQPLLQLGKTFSLTPEQGAQVGCGRGRRPASRRPPPANAACDAWHHAAAALHRTCASRLTPASLACRRRRRRLASTWRRRPRRRG